MDKKNPTGKITKVSIPKNQIKNTKPVNNFNVRRPMPKNTGRGR